jgi:MHS family proline/betaine transporter-like MFS transporter
VAFNGRTNERKNDSSVDLIFGCLFICLHHFVGYDFAVFGFFSDVIGQVFFPKDQSEDLSVMESFAVFGGAFLMRPIGGMVRQSVH